MMGSTDVVYIAGPMSNLPGFNYPAFNALAAELRACGATVLNPAENPEPECKSWKGYMRLALAQLVQVDVVYFLPGWENSKGARVEFFVATSLELDIRFA